MPEASQLARPLTTVRQHMQLLGGEAARLLMALLGGQQPAATHLRLPTQLIPRATTAPPR